MSGSLVTGQPTPFGPSPSDIARVLDGLRQQQSRVPAAAPQAPPQPGQASPQRAARYDCAV